MNDHGTSCQEQRTTLLGSLRKHRETAWDIQLFSDQFGNCPSHCVRIDLSDTGSET